MKRSFLLISLVMVIVNSANGQTDLEEKETIRRTLVFSPGNATKILEVDNVNGGIRLTGYDGRNVEMVANKAIRADTQALLEIAKKEVQLDIADRANTITIHADEPDHERSTTFSRRSHWHNRGYEVTFDYEIRVPRQTEIHLSTVNGGPIEIEDVAGDFSVNNINGAIEMRNISGSGRAHTINGPVRVTFTENPKHTSHFGSLNGDIDVTFRRNLSADLTFKTFNGGVYTDFPVTTSPAAITAPQRRNGKLVYTNEFSRARVGKGGLALEFDGFNGNIRIHQGK